MIQTSRKKTGLNLGTCNKSLMLSLLSIFPHIYTIAQRKNIKICESIVEGSGGMREWQVFMLRNLNDWEIGEFEELLHALSLITLNDSTNIPQWKLTTNGLFTVKSFDKNMFKYDDSGSTFPYRQMWKPRIPPMVRFLCGRLVGNVV